MIPTAMARIAMGALLILQCFHLLFISLHDWIPLGTLNDVKAIRVASPDQKLLSVTLLSLAPFAIGFSASVFYRDRAYPVWLFWWLWVSYGLLFVGELRAWWIPYLCHPDRERAARYRVMFGATHSFLPEHNGMRPNTLHVILHLATLATLIALGVITAVRIA
jgi:hypothetical protein